MLTCAGCGHENPEGARFCNGCGAALEPAGARREERKVVTVVFADLVGSTAAAERSDPEDVRAMLAAHHARVRTELERFGGTVEKFIGDAVVAVFGAPLVHEDDPERAVRAALSITDSAAEAGVELRVAVNTGEALVSLDARPADGEGMVAGDVVNTASRIQSAAPVNGVLVGETTYRATAHVIEYREAPPVEAKGKSVPVEVWEAVSPRARFGTDVDETPLVGLVGRDEEVDALRDALSRARRQREPQLVTLVGVPGIGKSRLVAELFAVVDADPDIITWRQGRCLPYGDGISYWALGEMAKAQAGVLEGDASGETELKLEECVAALITDTADAAWVTGHLKPLVGLGADAADRGEGRGEAFAAWRRFFEALAEQRPTVLVFEDLHWADDGLLDFVDGLVDRASGVPLLVLCSARPELLVGRPGWGGGKANAVTLSLSPLSDEQTAHLIAEHLTQVALPAELQQPLLRRAGGNPLFAEEYIRMLRDRGLLRREGQGWRLEGDDADVPETVQGIIAARLDALATEEKYLLQAAAVVGKVFWAGAVASVAGVSPWEAEERLHALERRELVRRDRRASVAGETEHAFRHVLVRDVAYGQIPRARRADLHLRAAAWIESLGEDRAEDRAETLAHHYSTALDLTRAAGGDTSPLEEPTRRALREAGNRAYALSALQASIEYYAKAIALWPADDPEYPHVLLDQGRALAWLRSEGGPQLEEAAARLHAAGEIDVAAEAEATLGDLLRLVGRQLVGREHNARAAELVEGLPDSRVTARVRAQIWRSNYLAGESVSLEEGARILALTEQYGTQQERLSVMITLATAQSTAGDPRGSIRGLERAVELARESKSHYAARACLNLSTNLGRSGDLKRAAQVIREGIELADRFGSRLGPWLMVEWAYVDYAAGDWDAAAETVEQYLALGQPQRYMDVVAHELLGSIASARGESAAAERHLDTVLRAARDTFEPQTTFSALGTCARLALDLGDWRRAEQLLDDLVAAAQPVRRYEISESDTLSFASAAALDRAGLLDDLLVKAAYDSPWVRAAQHIAGGRLAEAGDVLDSHGAVPHAAFVRLLEAELAGDETPGLRQAVTFYERVGATAYLARAERLLQASA